MALWIVLGLVAAYVAALAWIVRASLWPPRVPLFFAPGTLGLPQEDVRFSTADGQSIAGWWIGAVGPRRSVVAVLCHGYLMNRSELAGLAARLAQEGIESLAFDFRCHGDSTRAKVSLGFRERLEVRAACALARARRPDARVVLIGSSMGAVASALAVAEDGSVADGLVLDSAYSRLEDAILGWWQAMGGRFLRTLLFPTVWLIGPVGGFSPRQADVGAALASIPQPVLLLHGTRDGVARREQAMRNHELCLPPVELMWFESCGHSEARCVEPRKYGEAVLAFLTDIGNMPRGDEPAGMPEAVRQKA